METVSSAHVPSEQPDSSIPRSRPVEVAVLGALSTLFLASLALTMAVG